MIYKGGLTVIDVRGFLLKSIHAGNNKSDGNGLSWESGLTKFIDYYLSPILESTAPRKVIAVFDAGNELRTAIYPDYKKKRKEKSEKSRKEDPEAAKQIKTLMDKAERLLTYLGVKCVKVPGQEADDVIALLCQKLQQHITVYTVDADLLQLVNQKTYVILDGQLYNPGTDYKGVPLSMIALHKSMIGDQSDGYAGIPGFGPAKWEDLHKEFGWDGMQQLEECVKTGNFDRVHTAYELTKFPALKLVVDNIGLWSTCYQLAILHPEVCYGSRKGKPIVPVWSVRIPNKDEVHKLLMQIKAPDMLERLEKHFPTFTLITADNHETLRDAVSRIPNEELIAFDFESYDTLNHPEYQQAASKGTYVDVLSQNITGISFCMGPNFQENYYVSIDHKDTANLSTEWAVWLLNGLYTSENLPIVQNANFEVSVAKTHLGMDIDAPYDTAIMQSYVDENADSHLKGMTKDRFRYDQITYEEVTQGKPMCDLTAAHVLQYGCDDSLVTAFHFDLQNIIMQLEGSWEFYESEEVVHVLDNVQTFIDGTDIDYQALSEMEAEDLALIREKEAAIRRAMEANCMVKSQERQMADAKNLLGLWWEFEGVKLAAEGVDQDTMNETYQKLWEKAWAASVYVPFTSRSVAKEFLPTKTKINEILTLLDSELRMEKVTKNYLAEWFVVNDDIIEGSSEEVRTFLRRLAEAANHLTPKKRSGEEYEALKTYAEGLYDKYLTDKKQVTDGDELNFGSSPQMIQFLYGKLGLPLRVRSKKQQGSARDKLGIKGAPATGNKASAAAIVYDLQDESDWRRQVILDYMDIVKAQQNVSLYYKPYPLWKSPVDGKIHPQLKNCGTVTRRPSGTAPNVLQVSSKDDAKIRKAYIPPSKKYAYVCLDFNGQELRITASESGDKQMLAAYVGENKKDIHSLTASGFANIILPREGLTQFSSPIDYQTYVEYLKGSEYGSSFNLVRKLAKAVNFLIIYVGGYTTLAQNLLIAAELAKSLMNQTFQLYSGLQPWQKRVVEFARVHGYTETAYGNRRHLTKDLYSSDDFLRMRQERQAVNATIQGCAADILKHVLSEMRRRKVVQNYDLKALKPVYDEVAACVLIDAIPDYIEEMKEIMEVTPPGHAVPMEIEAAIGIESWGGKVELGRPSREEVVEFLLENAEGYRGN